MLPLSFALSLTAVLAAVIAAPALHAQRPPSPPDPLAPFVAEALRANLGLAERREVLDQREAAVREARGRRLPSLAVDARYTRPFGNVLDLGDAVNPAYAALNQLLGQARFPTDVSVQLPLRQETRLRVAQPLYQPAIGAAHAATRALHDAEDAGYRAQARALGAQVRLAYLDVARATRVVELYEATLPLVRENARVAERLVGAGRATPDVVLRARAEVQAVEQQRLEAAERRDAARRAFNLLLDRPLETPLALVPDSLLVACDTMPRDDAVRAAIDGREELQQLAHGRDAARAQERAVRAAYLPGVSAAVDYGVQGREYRFGRDADFILATVALQWNVYNGGQDAARREQAAAGARRVEVQRRDVERRIALEATQAWEGAEVARQAIAVAASRRAATERAYRLVERRYAEGAASLVEYTDARTAYTGAGLNHILTTYAWLARRVELERAAALRPLPTDLPR